MGFEDEKEKRERSFIMLMTIFKEVVINLAKILYKLGKKAWDWL